MRWAPIFDLRIYWRFPKRFPTTVLTAHLTPPVRAMLDDLFERDDGGNRYRLSLLRKLSQSSRPTKVRETAEDFSAIADLYDSVTLVLGALDLGREGIRYYAGGVLRSEMFQLHRPAEADRHLHAIAFIADQHHRLHDTLIDRLLGVVQSFETAAAPDHKNQVFEYRQIESARAGTLLGTLETEVFGAVRGIRSPIAIRTFRRWNIRHSVCRIGSARSCGSFVSGAATAGRSPDRPGPLGG